MIEKLNAIIKSAFIGNSTKAFFNSKKYLQHRLDIEKQRTSRNNNQISVIVMNVKCLKEEFKFSVTNKNLKLLLHKIFKITISTIRTIDVVAWYNEDAIVILLCDTSYAGAQLFIKRLKEKLLQFFVADYSEDLFLFDKIDMSIYTYPGKHENDAHSVAEKDILGSDFMEPINLNGQLSNNLKSQKREITKRIFDIILSYIGLLFAAPLMGIIAFLVKTTSPGTIIFRQKRIGYDGKTIEVLKFRTMYENADQTIHEQYIKKVITENEEKFSTDSTSFKVPNDQRITPVGRFLRNTCLDELPQLVNVLKGEMSLVGPRPHPIYEVSCYDRWYHRRLGVKPGLTGLWQIKGKKSMRYSDAIRLDLFYVDKRSLGLDFKILLYTLPTALAGFKSK